MKLKVNSWIVQMSKVEKQKLLMRLVELKRLRLNNAEIIRENDGDEHLSELHQYQRNICESIKKLKASIKELE